MTVLPELRHRAGFVRSLRMIAERRVTPKSYQASPMLARWLLAELFEVVAPAAEPRELTDVEWAATRASQDRAPAV